MRSTAIAFLFGIGFAVGSFLQAANAGQVKTYSSLPDRSKVDACTNAKQQAQYDKLLGSVVGYSSCNCDNSGSFWTCAVDATFSK